MEYALVHIGFEKAHRQRITVRRVSVMRKLGSFRTFFLIAFKDHGNFCALGRMAAPARGKWQRPMGGLR